MTRAGTYPTWKLETTRLERVDSHAVKEVMTDHHMDKIITMYSMCWSEEHKTVDNVILYINRLDMTLICWLLPFNQSYIGMYYRVIYSIGGAWNQQNSCKTLLTGGAFEHISHSHQLSITCKYVSVHAHSIFLSGLTSTIAFLKFLTTTSHLGNRLAKSWKISFT